MWPLRNIGGFINTSGSTPPYIYGKVVCIYQDLWQRAPACKFKKHVERNFPHSQKP